MKARGTLYGSRRPAALVVAHPGHELALHRWLESERPTVYVLTDGSGRTGRSRLDSTRRLIAKTGARPGEVFGALTDRRLYEALLDRETPVFAGLAAKIADAFVRHRFEDVVADPAEGYNPAHDVCRLVTDAALREASANGLSIRAWEYPLVRPAAGDCPGARRLVLDDEALARKRTAAESYPEMRFEVEAALDRAGLEAYRVEILRPMDPGASPFRFGDAIPQYEQYGESRVSAGHYDRVIRFRDHVRTLAEALGAAVPAVG